MKAGRIASCIIAILGLAPGCGEDGAGAVAPDTIAGGWSNEQERRFVCVASDGRMWLGDTASEIGGGSSPCTVSEAGTEFHCQDPDDGSAFDGTIDAAGDALTLEITACGGDASECRATYVRDASVTCDG